MKCEEGINGEVCGEKAQFIPKDNSLYRPLCIGCFKREWIDNIN